MLFPKKVKHRKWQTGRSNPKRVRLASRTTALSFGSHGLKALAAGRINSNQIEASRKVIRRALTKRGKMWVRIFPDRPYTAKGAEVPMGKGKGDPQGFVAVVEPGNVLFEIDGVDDGEAREALRKAGAKLPVKTRIVTRAV